jgi:protein translocase SecG subunit
MLWIIGLFTVVLVLDSLFLILLVLVQLPKKEAGVGQAFGGTATDALFGAGSGNALTKMTKYATGIFFMLTLAIYIMYNHHARSGSGRFAAEIQRAGRDEGAATAPPNTAAAKPPSLIAPLTTNIVVNTNASAPKATNQVKIAPLQVRPDADASKTPPAPAK